MSKDTKQPPIYYETFSDDMFKVVGREEKKSEQIGRPVLSNWQDGWLRLKKNKAAVWSLVILAVLIILAIVSPILSKFAYQQTDYENVFVGPSKEHWLGTDKFGRDQWTRLWQGTRISLFIGVLAATLDILIGITYGAISGLASRKVDNIMQRIIEILMGIPQLVVVILLIMILKPGILSITIAMVITGWISMARIVRGQVFKLKTQEYVLASRTLGAKSGKIITSHMLPNTIGVIIINMMFTIPNAIFTEAFLSFIGIGLQQPLASLGVLINDGYESLRDQSYLLVFPSIVIVAIMVCFNLLGDGLRDALDPRMRE